MRRYDVFPSRPIWVIEVLSPWRYDTSFSKLEHAVEWVKEECRKRGAGMAEVRASFFTWDNDEPTLTTSYTHEIFV